MKGITVLEGVIELDYHREIGLFLENESKKGYVWSSRDPLGILLALQFPAIKVKGKLPQPNPHRMTKSTDSLGMKKWVTDSEGEDLPTFLLKHRMGSRRRQLLIPTKVMWSFAQMRIIVDRNGSVVFCKSGFI